MLTIFWQWRVAANLQSVIIIVQWNKICLYLLGNRHIACSVIQDILQFAKKNIFQILVSHIKRLKWQNWLFSHNSNNSLSNRYFVKDYMFSPPILKPCYKDTKTWSFCSLLSEADIKEALDLQLIGAEGMISDW